MENICLLEIIPVGEENAISRRELMRITGLSDRELRRQIEMERREGALILSSTASNSGGYFRNTPGDAVELRRFINSMSQRGKSTFAVLKEARKVLAELEGGTNG